MKIVIFYQYFTTPAGSWGTRIYEFSKEWIKCGHDVTVVTGIYSKSDLKTSRLIDNQNVEGINVKVINVRFDNKKSLGKRILSFLYYSLISSWYALTLKGDIVIASSGPITVGFPGLVSKLFTRKKLVYEVRDLWPEVPIAVGALRNPFLKSLALWFEKKLYSNASLVVGLSPGMRDNIKKNSGHANVISITNSANLKLFGKKEKIPDNDFINEKSFYGIYTGNIGVINNSMLLVNTAKILQKKGEQAIKILLVGDGQLSEKIKSIIRKESLSNLIHFDLMPKEHLVAFIQNAQFSFVPLSPHPILSTSSPNKFFESLAAGVPVIQTTNGWIKEYIETNAVGFTVDGDNPEYLADLMIELEKMPEMLSNMKKNSARCASRDFDQKKLASLYLASMEKLQEDSQ